MIRRDVEDIVSREIHLAAAVQGLFSVWFLFLEGLNFIETFICARARDCVSFPASPHLSCACYCNIWVNVRLHASCTTSCRQLAGLCCCCSKQQRTRSSPLSSSTRSTTVPRAFHRYDEAGAWQWQCVDARVLACACLVGCGGWGRGGTWHTTGILPHPIPRFCSKCMLPSTTSMTSNRTEQQRSIVHRMCRFFLCSVLCVCVCERERE